MCYSAGLRSANIHSKRNVLRLERAACGRSMMKRSTIRRGVQAQNVVSRPAMPLRAVKSAALWAVQLFGFVVMFGAALVLIGGALIPAVIPFLLGLACALLRPWRNRRARRAELAALARRADAAYVSSMV